MHRLHGYDNIGFHMGKDFVTVDFSGLLTEEEIAEAERQANTVVLANERILAEYPCARELELSLIHIFPPHVCGTSSLFLSINIFRGNSNLFYAFLTKIVQII